VNPGLAFLLRAGVRGVFRRMGRRMRTVRGFASTVFGILFFLLLIGTQVAGLVLGRQDGAPAHGPAAQGFATLAVFFLVAGIVAAEAPFFWPQEVQFLFPAPLSRRQLLLYQLLSRGQVQLFSGLWFGLLSMRAAPHPAAAIPATVLAISFLFVVTQLAALLKIALADRLPEPARRALKPAAAVLLAAGALALWMRARDVGFGTAIGELFASRWMRMATLPGRPFGELFASGSLGGAVAWAAVCIALVGAAGAAVLAMRVDFRERSLVSSARRFERLRRMRANRSGPASTGAPARRRIPVPALGFLGSAAPVARRQVYELGRGLRVLWGLLFTALLAFFYVIVMPRYMADPMARQQPLGESLVALAVVFPLLASGTFTIDFRRDVERMAYLRSLPLSPRAMAVGEAFTAALVIALCTLALLAVAAAVAEWRLDRVMAVAAALAAAPVAWLAVTLENWLFLLFPTRIQADGAQQGGFAGKQILKLLFKLVVLGVIGGAAALAAAGGGWAGGTPGAAACAAVVIALACVGTTALLARAYRGFDLTLDTPA
jgi:ABC-2 type transport system permease protein